MAESRVGAENQMLQDIENAIEALGGPSKVMNLQEMAGDPVDCAKVQMGLAFAINSLFYCKSVAHFADLSEAQVGRCKIIRLRLLILSSFSGQQ